MKNKTLPNVVPSFNTRTIFDSLDKLGVCFDVPSIQEHVICLNQFCRLSFTLVKRTAFHMTLRMEVFDEYDPTFEMQIQVYPNQKTARALTLEQGGKVQRNALDSLNNLDWNVLEEINKYLQSWLDVCLESEVGPAPNVFVAQSDEGLGLCLA